MGVTAPFLTQSILAGTAVTFSYLNDASFVNLSRRGLLYPLREALNSSLV